MTGQTVAERESIGHEWVSSMRLSDKDFRRLSEMITSECGIKMPDSKRVMLEARLRKRLKALGMESYAKYCQYLFSSEGIEDELLHMIDVVTTNKTDFFREKVHFDYLVKCAVPELLSRDGTGASKKLVVWSAGCSTGEEPYSIAMALDDMRMRGRSLWFEIVATDISTQALQKAVRGVYDEERVKLIPQNIKKKYFMKSKDKERRLVRVVPELREVVRFERLNFLGQDYGFSEKPDIIFCRNVFIYFGRSTQEQLLRRFYANLTPGGYLFMGHCETLSQMSIPFASVGSMVYRKY